MFRCAISAVRGIRPLTATYYKSAKIICNYKNFSTLQKVCNTTPNLSVKPASLLNNKQILDISNNIVPVPARTVTKFSMKRGKRKTVKAVIRRFFRLHWGGWIRPKVGRHKKMWKKAPSQKRRLREHVFCNSTQNTMLDKMVTKYWKKPKHYVEDPYVPYHTRNEFPYTRTKPVGRD